ncbi:MAG: methyltransferase domain-containing protein [Lactobacillus sp.]|uniref:class I SAM-dependent methyltransferase n=1 Tax=Bombilactobacillus bombi TaxID=1303590 RepID=UPI0035E6CA29|nr:methyltransferase domain-containing protein [Lactobacillus sp.]
MENVFNKFFNDYDDWYQTPVGQFVDQAETQTLVKLLQPKAQQKILDVGCGTGNFTIKLAQQDCQVTGVDIAPNMLQQAQQKLQQQQQLTAQLKIMNVEKLSFLDNSFNAAFSMAAFEFINNIQSAYQEMWRVVQPGGHIVIGTIQKNGSWANFYESPACHGTAYEFSHFWTAEQLISLDPKHFVQQKDCLFLPPNLPENNYNLKADQNAAQTTNIGGFTCLLFQK